MEENAKGTSVHTQLWHHTHRVFTVISIILLGWHKNFHREPQNIPARSEGGPSNNGSGNQTLPLNSISWERRHSLVTTRTKQTNKTKTPNSHIQLSFVSLAYSVEKGRNQCLQHLSWSQRVRLARSLEFNVQLRDPIHDVQLSFKRMQISASVGTPVTSGNHTDQDTGCCESSVQWAEIHPIQWGKGRDGYLSGGVRSLVI